MPELKVYLIIGGILLLGVAIAQKRNPERVNNIWRAITTSLTLGALWFWQERIGPFGESLGYSWIFTLGLLALVVFALWGIFTRKPTP